MSARREDYLRLRNWLPPPSARLPEGYRMADQKQPRPGEKILTDERGKPIRLHTGEPFAQPQCWARRGSCGSPASIGAWKTSRGTSRDGRTPSPARTAWRKPGRVGEGHPRYGEVQHGFEEVPRGRLPDHDDVSQTVGLVKARQGVHGFRQNNGSEHVRVIEPSSPRWVF